MSIGIVGESSTRCTLRRAEELGLLQRKDTTPLSKLSESECQKILKELNSGMHYGPAMQSKKS